MQRSRLKKIPNPPRRCIFCGGTPISKEHVWADWMRPYLPRGQGTHLIQEGNFTNGSHYLRRGSLDVKGDLRSQKLKVVCGPCNNGWMSVLQNDTKPILLPLLTRKHGAIAADERKTLAKWATVFTFVFSTATPEYTTLDDPQRRAFKESQVPPEQWVYWCAPFDGLSSPTIQFGITDSKNVGPMRAREEIGDIGGAHVTLCGAGGICFATFSTNVHGGFQPFLELVAMAMRQAGFVQLWPTDGTYVIVGAGRRSAFSAADLMAIRDAIANGVRRAQAAELDRLNSRPSGLHN